MCHKWKKTTSEVEKSNCNPEKPNQWHQTDNNVVLTIYAKNANALTSKFSMNQVSIQCSVEYGGGKKYNVAFELNGVVNVEESKVVISGKKVEVKMRKNRFGKQWKEVKEEGYGKEIQVEEESKTE